MGDVVALGVVVAFFAVMVAYVRWCDGIVGPDPTRRDPSAGAQTAAAAAAPEDAAEVQT